MAEGGRIIYYLDVDDTQFTAGLENATRDAKKAGDSMNRSLGQRQSDSFKALGVSLAAVGFTLGKVLRDAVSASNRTENAFAGLASATRAYGQDAAKTRQAATDLSKDGLISVTTAAQGLESLFIGGVGLDTAIGLMKAYKDQAAFGKNATLSMDEAVSNLAQSFVTENSAIGNASGQQENYTNIIEIGASALGKSVAALSDKERAQAKAIGTQRIALVVEGNAAKLADTFSGKQARLQTAFFNLESQIGDVVKLGLAPFIDTVTKYITVNPKMVTSLVIATTAAVSFGVGVVALAGAVALAITIMGGPFTILLALVAAILGGVVFNAIQSVQEKMGALAKDFGSGSKSIADSAKDELSGSAAKDAKELAEKLGDIDKQIKKSKATFQEQLAEMVKASQDKVISLRKDLSEENQDFSESMEEKRKDFERENADEVKALGKRINDVQKSYDKEVAAAAKSQQKKLDEFNKALEREKEQYANASDQRLAVVEKQYAEELAKGKTADKARLIQLSNQINKERLNTKAAIDERIQRLKASYELDTRESGESNQEKLAAFQETINQEKADVAEAQVRRKEEYDADVLASKAAHDKKVLDTQTQLNAELELQSKHSADILAVKGFQFRDEFQKLRDNHNDEIEELEHQKVKTIEKAKETTSGINTELGKIGKSVDTKALQASGNALGGDIGKSVVDSFKTALQDEKNGFLARFKEGLEGIKQFLKTGDILGDIKGKGSSFSGIQSLLDILVPTSLGGLFRTATGRASGGPVRKGQGYVVGEKRPEFFVPDQDGRIIPDLTNLETSGSKQTNNYYTTLQPSFSGIVARSRSEWRDIVKDGLEAVNEDLRSRGIAELGGGRLQGGMSA